MNIGYLSWVLHESSRRLIDALFEWSLVQNLIESLPSTAELQVLKDYNSNYSPDQTAFTLQPIVFWTFLLEGLFDLCDARVLLHHQEIRFAVLVELTDPAEQEAGARVLIADNGDQFTAAGHHEAPQSRFSPRKDERKV